MKRLFYAIDPAPYWFQPWDDWLRDRAETPDALLQVARFPVRPPGVAYVWTHEGSLDAEEGAVIIRSVRVLGPVVLFAPPTVGEARLSVRMIEALKRFGHDKDLRKAPNKIEQPAQIDGATPRYWGAVLVGDSDIVGAARLMFGNKADFPDLLFTSRHGNWQVSAELSSQESWIKTLLRLSSAEEVLVKVLRDNSIGHRAVAVVHGPWIDLELVLDKISQLADARSSDLKDIWNQVG